MVAYVFSEAELKYLCGALKVRGLAAHQIKDNKLTDNECRQAVASLDNKGFISVSGNNAVINSGIELLVKTLGKAERILINKEERVFTAYIDKDISILLINDDKSFNYIMYPFENENELVERLHEINIYSWKDIRLEDNGFE